MPSQTHDLDPPTRVSKTAPDRLTLCVGGESLGYSSDDLDTKSTPNQLERLVPPRTRTGDFPRFSIMAPPRGTHSNSTANHLSLCANPPTGQDNGRISLLPKGVQGPPTMGCPDAGGVATRSCHSTELVVALSLGRVSLPRREWVSHHVAPSTMHNVCGEAPLSHAGGDSKKVCASLGSTTGRFSFAKSVRCRQSWDDLSEDKTPCHCCWSG